MKTLIFLTSIAIVTPAHADEYDRQMNEMFQTQAGIDARYMDLNARQDRLRMIQQNDELIRIQRESLRRSSGQPQPPVGFRLSR